MEILVYNSIIQLKDIWHEIQEQGYYYGFQMYEWLIHWNETIGAARSISPVIILVKTDEGVPLMVLPLGIEKKYGISILKFLDGWVSDYNAPILAHLFTDRLSENEFKEIWKNINQAMPRVDFIHFQKIPELVVSKYNPLLNLNCKADFENSYYISLNGTWDEFYSQRIKKKIKNDSRRQRKRLAQLGQLNFVIASNPNDIKQFTDALIEQKSERYRAMKVRNIFNNSAYREFYHKLAQDLAPKGKVHISALLLNETIIAVHWGLILNDRFYFLMPTFQSGEWKKYSAGRLLLEHLIEYSFMKKLKIFDFTVGEEAYKKIWCDREMKLYEYLKPTSYKGYIYYCIEILKTFIKKHPTIRQKIHKYILRY